MKHIANTVTILRILLSLVLLILKPSTAVFLIVYTVCGLSDIIDGYIARKTKTASCIGSILDSIADIIFLSAALIIILPTLLIPKGILIWIALIAFTRMVSLWIVYYKHHTFAILHTYANKIMGFLLFCFPYLYINFNIYTLGIIMCTAASIASIEELVINMTSKELIRDIPGIFVSSFWDAKIYK